MSLSASDKKVCRERLLLLREWVIAEIDYAIASGESGPDGYYSSARAEKDYADNQFNFLVSALLGDLNEK